AASQDQPAADGADGDGRAQGRRPAARQQGVTKQDKSHDPGGASLTDAQSRQDEPQKRGQNDQVLAGYRQNVDGAGPNIFVPVRPAHGRAFAQEQGAGQSFGAPRQRVAEDLLPPAANHSQPATRGCGPSPFEARHGLRRLSRGQYGANALVAQ